MKKLVIILSTILLFSCQSHQPNHEIVGTWKLVSFTIVNNGKAKINVPDNGKIEQLKSWSKESFVFAGKTTNNNIVSYSYGNGKYTLQGNHYKEDIKVHISPLYEGKDLKLYMEISGDTLTQIFPVKNDWSYDKENCWIEKYIRIK